MGGNGSRLEEGGPPLLPHVLGGIWMIYSYLLKLFEQPMKKAFYARASLLFVAVLTASFIFINWLDLSIISGNSFYKTFLPSINSDSPAEINCSVTCPAYTPVALKPDHTPSKACPDYFRWIHQDLNPWKETGVTKKMIETAEEQASIRIVVLDGKVYVKKYKVVYQTRDVFTVWGILQLLRLYPGKLPDLDIVFECGDKPVVKKSDHRGRKPANIPPMFHYCGSESTLDIAFPDWSFWGWPELKIKPWEILRKELEEGNHKMKWMKRQPYAYWKGNSRVSPVRKELLKCNLTAKEDWNALIYELDWGKEHKISFKNTDLANQCTHRYKIYVEGAAWSVSEKYILACDSMSLLITPHYYDFFTRSLQPTVHYWPIDEKNKCRSIKFAVDWGNKNTKEAQKIGKEGSKFIQEELQMRHVYDYMFHLLNEYGKLLKYKPIIPQGSIQVCSETLACSGRGIKKRFKIHSMVKNPSDKNPCAIPPPYDPTSLQDFLQKKQNLTNEVERWEARANNMRKRA